MDTKVNKFFVIIGFLALFFMVVACQQPRSLEGIEVDAGQLQQSYEVEDFELEKIDLILMYDDGSESRTPLTDTMVEDHTLFNLGGRHTIFLEYEGFTTSFTVDIIDSDLTELRLQLYDQGVTSGAIEDQDYEEWLDNISGEDGKEVVVSVSDTHIMWQYEGEDTWTNLIALDELEGDAGKEVVFGLSQTHIQWQYEGDETWIDLVSLEELKGDIGAQGSDGSAVIFDVSDTHIIWQYEGEDSWQDLIDLDALQGAKGDAGVGIETVTYDDGVMTVTLTDGKVMSFELTTDFYYVQFKGFDDNVFEIKRVLPNESLTPPLAPEVEGYTFSGYSQSLENIETDMTVYALYEVNSYVITFQTQTDEVIESQTVAYNDSLIYPIPEKPGYHFFAWYTDETLTTLFTDRVMPSEDITLYARYVKGYTSIDVVGMLEGILPSVVGVENTDIEDNTSVGSGAIYKAEATDTPGITRYYVVTNHHVIEDFSTLQIIYNYYDNLYVIDFEDIEYLGSHVLTDTAVLTFESHLDFDVIPFADSYALKIGQRVYAIGNPLGFAHFGSVTEGIISNLTRFVGPEDTEAYYIQTDAAVNPGNSGGILIDETGSIIGMNTWKYASETIDNMAYALPSNTMTRVIEDLEVDGFVTLGDLGVELDFVTECGYLFGACIFSVNASSTAETMGLEAGDMIIGYQQETMTDFRVIYNENQLNESILNTRVDTLIRILYVRDGNYYETNYEPLKAK